MILMTLMILMILIIIIFVHYINVQRILDGYAFLRNFILFYNAIFGVLY
jgi:hypothetical protein